MPLLYTLFLLSAFCVGLAVGSFINVCIYRIPEGRSVLSPASACPSCHTPLAPKDNIPVLSWLLLRARCRTCNAKISPQYPLVELTTGLLAWLLFRTFIPGPSALNWVNGLAWGVFFIFTSMLLIAGWVDLRSRIIPESVSLYAIPLGVACSFLLETAGYDGLWAIGWKQSVLGVALWGGLLATLSTGWYWIRGEEGLAWGDVRLVAMMGAFLGALPGMFFVLMIASVTSVAVALGVYAITRRSPPFPWGPFLALGGITTLLFGGEMLTGLFGPLGS